MAAVHVTVYQAYVCDHCSEIVVPVEQLYRDGPRLVVRHSCADGFEQGEFNTAVGMTRTRIEY